jgi:superfamily II DNA or RNA helicase
MKSVTSHTLRDVLDSLAIDNHIRGKQFERLAKWWLHNTPINPFAPHKITNIWLWDEWPDRPGPDIGIDLVAQLEDGSLCAIQAKCIDESADIPKSQLDSFISAASPAVFAHRLLIASTDGLSTNARRMLQDQHVIRVMRTELEASITLWPASIDALGEPVIQPKWDPRPHQREAINNVLAGFEKYDRGQMIMACGTGKTLTALWITEQLAPSTTLVLVPSLSLLSQTLSEWAQHTTSPWPYICVCSDDTVNKNNDEPISTVDDFPFEVTTDPARIADFLDLGGRKIIFSTYQSSAQVAAAIKDKQMTIDLAICDEAHRLTGKTDANYATILDNTKIPATKRLFMTATPRTYTPTIKNKAEERGVDVTSMDDEHIYGPVLHTLSFGEAISRDLLSDYRVVIVGVTDPQVQELIDRRELVTVNNDVDTDARTLAAHIGLAKATKDYNLTRTISFHSRISTAAKFAADHAKILEWLPEGHTPSGTTWTGSISGAMNTGDRRRLLNQLSKDEPGRHALLTNARCLTEGVDVPSLDGVAFIDPRSSQVDIIQAVGRAIRKSESKRTGTIVLPVLIPNTADIANALDDSAFKPIWAILNALKAHDENLGLKLSELRSTLGRLDSTSEQFLELRLDLPIDIDSVVPNFADALAVGIVERSTSSWDYMFGQLLAYVDAHGHARPPARKVGRDWLSQWVAEQRYAFSIGKLAKHRCRQLEALPGWTWDPLGESWHESFTLLQSFAAEFGHANVPTNPRLYRGFGLASWVNVQRTKKKKGELDAERVELLEKIPGWTWAPKEDQYRNAFQALAEYAINHGHCRPPRNLRVTRNDHEINLATWTASRRREYSQGRLSRDRIIELESLPGWSWDPLSEEWTEWFELLQLYIAEFGHARVPQKTRYRGRNLAMWVSGQRQRYLQGTLEPDRVELLEGLPVWSWRPQDDDWENQFRKLEELAIQHGDLEKVSVLPGELEGWSRGQRLKFRDGRLSRDRIFRLESVPGWSWSVQEVRILARDRYLQALSDYVSSNGHASPPRSVIVNDIKLGEWVKAQRLAYRDQSIQVDLKEHLASLPGWTWDPFEDSWKMHFSRVAELAQANGGTVPRLMPTKDLGTWVTRQRKLHSLGQLSAERTQALNQLRGWSWTFSDVKDEKWDEMFQALASFSDEQGTSRIRDKAVYRGLRLGTWVSVQRRRFAEGTITDRQRDLLSNLPRWSWDPIEDDWHEMFQRMRDFAARNGKVWPRGHIAQEAELAQWVGVQRAAYKDGKISSNRIHLLESIEGWQWAVRSEPQREADWERHFRAVTNFVTRTGSTRVSKEHVEDGVRISFWIQKQRKLYAQGNLSADKIAQLEGLSGWTWDAFADSWELRFRKVKEFIAREGHGRVPQGWVEDGVDIGVWVNTQRTKFNKGMLDAERSARLTTLPGWTWDPLAEEWDRRFSLLEKFVRQYGHAAVPDQYRTDGVQLGKWVGKQRQAKKAGRLSQDRTARLESLNGWTW